MSNDIWLESFLKQNLVMTIVDISFQNLGHHVRKGSEERPEVSSQKRASHVKSLLAIVVTIVFVNKSERCLNQLVGHVAKEELFLVHSIRQDRNVREEL